MLLLSYVMILVFINDIKIYKLIQENRIVVHFTYFSLFIFDLNLFRIDLKMFFICTFYSFAF